MMVRLGNRLFFSFRVLGVLTSYLSGEECWIINKEILSSFITGITALLKIENSNFRNSE